MNKNINILVVEDDPDLSAMIKLILQHKGYSVSITEKGEEVFNLLTSHSFNLVIMDMLLSGVNGKDICATLKRNDQTSHIPIIMMSALQQANEICLMAGADDFVSKPFDINNLLFKVNNHINTKHVKVK